MDPIIEQEIMRKHNQADAFISLFFAGLDCVCYIVILTLFGFDFKTLKSPKLILSLLIALDAVLRIMNIYTDEYSKYFIKEFLFTLFSTIQFNMIITCFNLIFTDKSSENSLQSELEIKNKGMITGLFFLLIFSFKGIMDGYKLVSALQYICIIMGILIMSKDIDHKIEIFLTNFVKKESSFSSEHFLLNIPFYITIYLIINYIFELLSLLVEHKLYASYMIMICKIFKEVGKYLVFLLLIILYHIFSKYMLGEDYEFGTIEAKVSNDKSKVNNIYKEEEDYDDI